MPKTLPLSVAEVLAAAVSPSIQGVLAYARSPKLLSCMAGYSADVELVFWSWQADVLANIQDRELDNKAAIQLIKEQTLDNARR